MQFDEAFALAVAHAPAEATVSLVAEYEDCWHFAYPQIGSSGMLVHKQSGALFEMGSAYPVQRDLALCRDLDWRAEHDLVVSDVSDLLSAVSLLEGLSLRRGKACLYARYDLAKLLAVPPVRFANQNLYFAYEAYCELRDSSSCTVRLHPPTNRDA